MNRSFDQLSLQDAEALTKELAEIALRHNRATDGTIATAFAYVTVVIAT
jgi:hypothetical protein